MKKTKITAVILAAAVLSLAGCGTSTASETNDRYQEGYQDGYSSGYEDGGHDADDSEYDAGYKDGYADGSSSDTGVAVRPGTNLDIHTEKQSKYLAANASNIGSYASGTEEICAPKTFQLDFSDIKFPVIPSTFSVRLSEDADFSEYREYKTNTTSVSVTNLKLNTDYYWYATGSTSGGKYVTQIFSFSTEDGTLRNLYVPGTTNWRDLGNYKTSDGKTIKQGLIYRSAAFSFYDGNTVEISDETKDVILNDLKIKTEIDLAGTATIDGVNRLYYRMEYSGISNLIDDAGNQASIKSVFEAFGKEENYPAVFHCSRGRDRTGAIAFLLGGYLGMSQSDLFHDYLFTNFSSNNSCSISVVQNYVTYLSGYEGSTLRDQTKNYLTSIGVSEETLTNIDTILKQ